MNKLSTIFTVRHRIQTTWSRSFKSSNRGKKLFPIRGPLLLAVSMNKSKESTQNEHITRQKLMTKITEDKEKYLHMTLEEKRKLYKCDDKYNTLDGVLTWEDYYNKIKHLLHRRNVKKNHYGKGFGVKREIRPDLNKKVSLWRGDITTLEIDAIVNAANESLLGGGGVDGAIHRAAGKKLVEECATLRGCKTGEAKITGGYKLPSKYVIHTVGPIGEQKERLKSSYDNCLKLVHENNLVSVAFPCISTGIYGYANEKAAPVAIETVRDWLEDEETSKEVQRVIFCLFLQKDVDIYEELMQHYFPVVTDNDRLEGESRSDDQVTALKDSEENEDNIKNKKIKKEIKSDIKDKTMDESDNKTETTDTKTERNYVNLNSEDTTMKTNSEHKSPEENKMEISECHDEKKNVITTKEKIDNTGESDQSDEKKTIILEHKTMNINSGSEEQDKKKNDAPDENKGEMNMEVNESKNVESCVKDMDTSNGNFPERKETTNKPLTRQGLKEAKNNKTI